MFGNTGDDLANFWGLIASGIAVAGVGSTLAHRLYRWAFIGLGALFLITGLFWAPIKSAAPGLRAVLTEITSNPSNWFLVFILAIAALWLHQYRREYLARAREAADSESRLIDEYSDFRDTTESRLRGFTKSLEGIWEKINSIETRADPAPVVEPYKVGKWMRADEAVKVFCSDLEAQIKSILKQNRVYREEIDALRKQLRELASVIGAKVGQNVDAEVLEQNAKTTRMKDLEKKWDDGHREIRNLNGWERQTLVELLEEGKLVAQGFLSDRQANSPPINIPKEEWRLLRFDPEDIFWQRVTGPNAEYVGMRLGVPEA